ncbi:uncharacterized protein LOC125669744 isoform X1 [Ostrea edulis]|uniref:uncharacterized protein LOC125669744 isoform X1 n=1 Tax=Ostrea edulis TaxID=37623 RepID=UPI0024AF17E4|nr:uncharacterized protein LOC125669744 isoform X1 [Ostrea edulis]
MEIEGAAMCFLVLIFSINSTGVRSLKYKAVSLYPGNRKITSAAESAVDGDPFTFAQTDDGVGSSWNIEFFEERSISCFELVVSAGSYDVNVKSRDQVDQNCTEFELDPNFRLHHNISKCCNKEMKGTEFTITRRDKGPLRLYEVQFEDCPDGHYMGEFTCIKCSNSCQSCDSVNGNCLACAVSSWYGNACNKQCSNSCQSCDSANGNCLACAVSSWYGNACNKQCPYNCSNGKCDISTGLCHSCYPGHYGSTCQPCATGRYGVNCGKSCTRGCEGGCEKETGHCYKCKTGFFQPPYCFKCNDSILNCVACHSAQKCDVCDTGYEGEKCINRDAVNCSKCEGSPCLCSRKLSTVNSSELCENCSNVYHNSTPQIMSLTTEGHPVPNNGTNETMLLTILFGMIILVLLLILLLLKRLKVLKASEKVGLTHSREQAEELYVNVPVPQNIMGDEANSIFLEEITHADDIDEDEVQRLDVEYTNTIANRIPVDTFIQYHNIRRENNLLEEEEFAKIATGLMEMYTEAVKKENISKNRYRHVYPYDFCRVVLDTSEEQGSNGYINACYVEGIEGDHAYIAAQGPFTPNTLVDFWRMIWQENSSRIVMLTNLFEGDHMKCLKYWSEEEIEIGEFVISIESQEEHEMYTIRYLIVQKDEEMKKTTHYHFTGWPDRGVPADVDNLLCFRDLVKNGRPESDGPIIVHCSAGIGRTGTFIALDYLLEEGSASESVDVINCVSKLRQQRAHSIQTKEQYTFLYDALAQGLKNIRRRSLYHVVDEL